MTLDFDTLLHRPLFEVFGVMASYTPPGGGASIGCTVILDARDRELEFGRGAAVMQGQTLQVRRTEVSAPAKGGTFAVGFAAFTGALIGLDLGEAMASLPDSIDRARAHALLIAAETAFVRAFHKRKDSEHA